MKQFIKIAFVIIVIFGLVASYIFQGNPVRTTNQQANQSEAFDGPGSAPDVAGPGSSQPGQ